MISPIPFCPSFEPCAKLTPVQVSTNRDRTQKGGGSGPSGARYRAGTGISHFATSSSSAAATNPMIGENKQRLTDPDRLRPIDTAGPMRMRCQQLVGQADA